MVFAPVGMDAHARDDVSLPFQHSAYLASKEAHDHVHAIGDRHADITSGALINNDETRIQCH